MGYEVRGWRILGVNGFQRRVNWCAGGLRLVPGGEESEVGFGKVRWLG